MLQGIQRHLGNRARVRAFTLVPDDTTRRHGIRAGTIVGYSIPGTYGVQGEPDLHRFARTLRSEGAHLVRSWRAVGELDLLVASGGGQIDEEWGGPWGHPYVLYRWARLASLRRVPFAILSTGTGRIESRRGRSFVRGAFRRAAYRSFRDEGSRDLALPAGAEPTDPVVPDLAFGLEVPPAGARRKTGRPLVGIAPMVFEDPRHWPVKDGSAYGEYVRRLAATVCALAAAGFAHRWLVSDLSDRSAVTDVRATLPEDVQRTEECAETSVTGVRDLIEGLSSVSVLVASRLHAILLGYVTGTPAVGLSYDRKVDVVMRGCAQEGARLDIRTFTPEQVVAIASRLSGDEAARSAITREVARCRAAVDQQYRRVLSIPGEAR